MERAVCGGLRLLQVFPMHLLVHLVLQELSKQHRGERFNTRINQKWLELPAPTMTETVLADAGMAKCVHHHKTPFIITRRHSKVP